MLWQSTGQHNVLFSHCTIRKYLYFKSKKGFGLEAVVVRPGLEVAFGDFRPTLYEVLIVSHCNTHGISFE